MTTVSATIEATRMGHMIGPAFDEELDHKICANGARLDSLGQRERNRRL